MSFLFSNTQSTSIKPPKVIPNNLKMSQTLTFASLYTIIRLIERSCQLDTKQKKKEKETTNINNFNNNYIQYYGT
ncbi:hypothetical protein MGQ_02902 [Candida albicans P76067]|nr:hypothetical protein MGK_02913 [Candida albicans P57055]KHC37156.1 hypothetical protein MGQ_02902 [Candida albicans P76067]